MSSIKSILNGIGRDCDNMSSVIGAHKDLILINYSDFDKVATQSPFNRQLTNDFGNKSGLTDIILKAEKKQYIFEGTDYSVVPSVTPETKEDGTIWYSHSIAFTVYSKSAETRQILQSLSYSKVVAVTRDRSTGLYELFGVEVGLKVTGTERAYTGSQTSNFYTVTIATPDIAVIKEKSLGELSLKLDGVSSDPNLPNPSLSLEELLDLKEDKSNKGIANGYAPLDSNAKVPALNLPIVNDFETGGIDKVASAETVKLINSRLEIGLDNIRTDILIPVPTELTRDGFAEVINNLPYFEIKDFEIPSFVTTIDEGVEGYKVDLVGVGKGFYGSPSGITIQQSQLRVIKIGEETVRNLDEVLAEGNVSNKSIILNNSTNPSTDQTILNGSSISIAKPASGQLANLNSSTLKLTAGSGDITIDPTGVTFARFANSNIVKVSPNASTTGSNTILLPVLTGNQTKTLATLDDIVAGNPQSLDQVLSRGNTTGRDAIFETYIGSVSVFRNTLTPVSSNIISTNSSTGTILSSTNTASGLEASVRTNNVFTDTIRITPTSASITKGSNVSYMTATEISVARNSNAIFGKLDSNSLSFKLDGGGITRVSAQITPPNTTVELKFPVTSGTLALLSDIPNVGTVPNINSVLTSGNTTSLSQIFQNATLRNEISPIGYLLSREASGTTVINQISPEFHSINALSSTVTLNASLGIDRNGLDADKFAYLKLSKNNFDTLLTTNPLYDPLGMISELIYMPKNRTSGSPRTMATLSDFKTINGESIVGDGNLVVEGADMDFQGVLNNGRESNVIGANEHFKLISKFDEEDIDNHTITFKNNSLYAEYQEKGYIYSEIGILPVHSLVDHAGFSLNSDGIAISTNENAGIGRIKSDNVTGDKIFQLPNHETVGSVLTLVSSVNGVVADIFGNVEIDAGGGGGSQTLQETLEHGSTGTVSTSITLGFNAVDSSTSANLSLSSSGIGLNSNNVLNANAKTFIFNSGNGGGFLNSGDPATNSPFRINSQGAKIEIGGGAGGIDLQGQGGNIKMSGSDSGDGGITVNSRLGVGRIKNIGTSNLEIDSTKETKINSTDKTVLSHLSGDASSITMDLDAEVPRMNIFTNGTLHVTAPNESINITVSENVGKGISVNGKNIIRSFNGLEAGVNGDFVDETRVDNSAGAIQGFAVTDNGNGTVNIASGTAFLKSTNDPYAALVKYTIPAVTNLALTDNATNYVLVDYNAGSPALTVTVNSATINTETNSIALVISRVGNVLDYLSLVGQNVDANAKLRVRFLNQEGIRRLNGAALGFSNRNLTLTAGVLASGLIKINTPAFNTATPDTFTLAYNNGTVWTRTTGQTQINNTQYNNAGVLTNLPTGDYRTDYVYLLPNNPSKLYVIMGATSSANITAARAAAAPSVLPTELQVLGVLVGRVIIQRLGASISEVSSAFDTVFPNTPIPEHNSLAGLQGGNVGDYQHITTAEKALVGTIANKQVKDEQLTVNGNSTVQSAWDGQTIIFTGSGTITVPASLPTQFSFNAITLVGVTITWAITTPFVWLFGTPANTPEKTYLNFTRIGNTNNIILGGA